MIFQLQKLWAFFANLLQLKEDKNICEAFTPSFSFKKEVRKLYANIRDIFSVPLNFPLFYLPFF